MTTGLSNKSSGTKPVSPQGSQAPSAPHKQQTFPQVTPLKGEELPLTKIKRVTIDFIDQKDQRYATVGDWVITGDGTLVIKATRFDDPRCHFAVAIHELVEAILCTQDGVTSDQVDEFDMGPGVEYDEPGKHLSAPYHMQHVKATAAENRLITSLGMDWHTYDQMVADKGSLTNKKGKSHGNEASNA